MIGTKERISVQDVCAGCGCVVDEDEFETMGEREEWQASRLCWECQLEEFGSDER